MRWVGVLAALALLLPGAARAATLPAPDPGLRKVLLEAVSASSSFDDRFEAEVWLSDMSTRMHRFVPKAMPDLKERLDFLRLLHAEAARAGVHPELVLAVIEVESRFDRFAVSSAGAQGYMQVMPFWLVELNRPYDNLFKAPINLRLGCTILKFYLDREHGDMVKALARYNGSIGKPHYSWKVMDALTRRWFRE